MGMIIGFKLPNEYNVLANNTAIMRATKWLRYYKVNGEDIAILSDSQAAIKSLTYVPNLIHESRKSLNKMTVRSINHRTKLGAGTWNMWWQHNCRYISMEYVG